MYYKGYDVEVTLTADESSASLKTTYAIYRGNRRVFTGLTTADVTSTEHGERGAFSAARRWIDKQS